MAKHFLECAMRAPECRGLGARRRWQVLAESSEHLSDETFRGPIRKPNLSARLADAQEFGSGFRLVRCEHDAESREDYVEGSVIERKTLGVRLYEFDREPVCGRTRTPTFKQSRDIVG